MTTRNTRARGRLPAVVEDIDQGDESAQEEALPTGYERIELGDGQWAIVDTRPPHGKVKTVTACILRARANPEAGAELDATTILAITVEWLVRDPRTHEPLELSFKGIDRAPNDIVEALAYRGDEIIGASRPNPNGTARSS